MTSTSTVTRRLGFGTPALMAIEAKGDRFRLLEAAVEAGIMHFDSSPYYGYGEVEPLLGEFLRVQGGTLTVTTKFGIQPPPRLLRGSMVVRTARRLSAISPHLKRIFAQGASRMVTRTAFDPSEAKKSLRSSLRNLRRDFVDYFLLHEPSLQDTQRPGLHAFLQRCVDERTIGQFGVGATWNRVSGVISQSPVFAGVVQFENPPPQDHVPEASVSRRMVITYGCIGKVASLLQQRVAGNDRELCDRLQRCGVDALDDDSVGAALLSRGLNKNPDGMVLFATRGKGRLKRMVELVRQDEWDEERRQLFEETIAGVL